MHKQLTDIDANVEAIADSLDNRAIRVAVIVALSLRNCWQLVVRGFSAFVVTDGMLVELGSLENVCQHNDRAEADYAPRDCSVATLLNNLISRAHFDGHTVEQLTSPSRTTWSATCDSHWHTHF